MRVLEPRVSLYSAPGSAMFFPCSTLLFVVCPGRQSTASGAESGIRSQACALGVIVCYFMSFVSLDV